METSDERPRAAYATKREGSARMPLRDHLSNDNNALAMALRSRRQNTATTCCWRLKKDGRRRNRRSPPAFTVLASIGLFGVPCWEGKIGRQVPNSASRKRMRQGSPAAYGRQVPAAGRGLALAKAWGIDVTSARTVFPRPSRPEHHHAADL